MHWILSIIGTVLLTVVLEVALGAVIPASWKRPDQRRRFAIVTFLLMAALSWVTAMGILFSGDHMGAATPHDATVVGVELSGEAGVMMCGFALAAAAHDGTSRH